MKFKVGQRFYKNNEFIGEVVFVERGLENIYALLKTTNNDSVFSYVDPKINKSWYNTRDKRGIEGNIYTAMKPGCHYRWVSNDEFPANNWKVVGSCIMETE